MATGPFLTCPIRSDWATIQRHCQLDWTTSVAIADLNGDGFADLYEVNYCDGSEPYEQPCRSKATGKLASCTPLNFRAQRDRVWKGEGDGSFSEATDTWLPNQDSGRGLGIIVGNFDQRAGIDLYIANDMTRNQYLTARKGDDSFGLTDLATIHGVGGESSFTLASFDGDGGRRPRTQTATLISSSRTFRTTTTPTTNKRSGAFGKTDLMRSVWAKNRSRFWGSARSGSTLTTTVRPS